METIVVIPCYNEERRLKKEEVLRLTRAPDVGVILVDDGSTDGTRALLEGLAQHAPGRVGVVAMPRNSGKSEAVRTGLLKALREGARRVGYLDADFSTPASEWLRLLGELQTSGAQAVLGSRVMRAGARIERRGLRHLMGRVFATAAAAVLRERFYDTQCGAKLFVDSPALREALSAPFHSRWAFDVELLGRLLTAREPVPFSGFVEVPLLCWEDVRGSKLPLLGMLKTGLELLRIGRELSRRRRRRRMDAS